MSASCFPAGGGKPRLLSEQCETCIYRPGNLMHLSRGRLRQMTQEALQEGNQGVICHDTLDLSAGAVCRGFYDLHGYRNNFIRVIQRIGGFQEIPPPEVSR